MSFVHLHVHSCYSLLDGAIKLKDLVNTAKAMGMPAVALTDHGQMFGILQFYKAAHEAGIKPILGVEAYVAPKSRRVKENGEVRSHLILLAQNMAGYRNLCRIISKANISGFYYRPRVDKDLLREHNEGVIALSACLQGEIPRLITHGHLEEAERAAAEYAEIFKDRFYLELQENGLEEQGVANRGLMALAKKMGLPLVATNDCHYLKKEHHDVHDVLLCIQTGKKVDDENRLRFTTREYYFKSPAEMEKAFAYCPEAVANTLAIADGCEVEFPAKVTYAFPAIKLDAGETPEERMARLAKGGLETRFEELARAGTPFAEEKKAAYRQRLQMEIDLIIKMGFPGYFLIVADFISWAKHHDIPVGPGRGSAAGSLVAYAMTITDVDPIRFGLLFERFLNPERISMPDIDVDFCTDGREEVIKYVTQAYGGKEQVSQIITFGQMKAKAVIRDVGRALGITYGEADRIAKLVPGRLNITLEEALKEEPKIGEAAAADPKIAQLLEYAKLLEGLPRHASMHAAGVVIGDKPLMEHCPLYCDPGTPEVDGEKTQVVTQWDMKGVESIGLIKFDFLGLKTLTLIKQCLQLIAQSGATVDLQHVDLEDAATYALLARGDTTGVFQLESSGMREILVKLRPNTIYDLMGLVALYRPGPLGSGMVDQFIDGKHGKIVPVYDPPQLKPILEETYGVILYQEQVMRVSQALASYSLGEADLLRRAMGKKKPEEMAKQKARFMEGAKANHVNPKKAEEIFTLMAKFAEYGFNKSHSAAYAIVAYQTAYLKAHYPVEFMAALMTSERDNQDKVVKLIGECHASGVKVRPPDVNDSGYKFTVAGGAIRFGLGAVKGLGAAAIEAILEARAGGPFTSLYDFCERVDTQKVNRKVVESLIKCGAFDQLGGSGQRAAMAAAMDDAMEAGASRQRDRRSGQSSIFDFFDGGGEGGADAAPTLPNVPPWPDKERLAYEREFLGFFLTGHPLEPYEAELSVVTDATVESLKDKPDKAVVRLGGLVEKVATKKDKKGGTFAYVTLGDVTGSVEVLVWADTFAKCAEALRPEAVAVVTGTVDSGERAGQATLKVIARDVLSLTDAVEQRTKAVNFSVPAALVEAKLPCIKGFLAQYPGRTAAHILLGGPKGRAVYRLKATVRPCRELIEAARRELGPGGLQLM